MLNKKISIGKFKRFIYKIFTLLNLSIFLFGNFFVLLPVPTAAASSGKLTGFNYTESYKSGELYNVVASLSGSGTVGITYTSTLGRQVSVPKSVNLNNTLNFEIKCGDTVNLTIGGTVKTVKSPACTNEVSSCQNPVGWVEASDVVLDPINEASGADPSRSQNIDTKGMNWTRYYFATDKSTARYDENPQDNSGKYRGIICAGTSKKNYALKDLNVKELKKFAKVANKLEAKEVGKFSYISSGNDYKAYFAKNAGDGFYFENKDGTKIEVVNVAIGGVKLNSKTAPSLNVDSITYYSVLPDIDLVYQLDTDGVSKQLILRNQNALKNNLSSIEFTLASGDLKKESPTKVKLDQKIAEAKVDKYSTNVDEIKKQKSVVNSLLPNVSGPTVAKPVDDLNLNQLEDSKNTELDKLIKKIDSKLEVNVAAELDRIDNLPVKDEKVVLKSGDTGIRIDLPVSYSQNEYTLLKSESVKVSADGKKLTILPDISSIKSLDKKYFPFVIDPRFAGTFGASDDTFTDNEGPYRNNYWGGSWAMVVGGRDVDNSYAAIYTNGVNSKIGNSEAYIHFSLGGIPTNIVNSAVMKLNQYGAWQVNGSFVAEVIRTNSFSEGSLTYNNRPSDINIYGYISFLNVNYNGAGQTYALYTDVTSIVRDSGNEVYIKLRDQTTNSKSATFCSRDVNPNGGPCNGGKGPTLDIYLNAAPDPDVNYGPNQNDSVEGCVGQNCHNSRDIQYVLGNMNDGYQNRCISSNIFERRWEKDTFSEWRYPNNLGSNWTLFWSQSDRRVIDNSAGCGTWMAYSERKMSGTYWHHHQLYNEGGMFSGGDSEYPYLVDVSGPVQVTPNASNIPAFKNNGNIQFTVPQFIDESTVYVAIQNAEGGVIDANGAIAGNTKDTQISTNVYGADPSFNPYQSWVIESNGQIRTLADGRCLTYRGGDLQMSTLRCQTNSTYTTNAAQGYEYLPESRQIRLVNDRYWCIAKESSNLMLRACSTANNQKWDIIIKGNPFWTYTVNLANKKVQYQVTVYDAANGILARQTAWSESRNLSTDPNFSISNLEGGKKYNIFVQARDRSTGTANYSDKVLLGSTTIDLIPPAITVYTQTLKKFSPNNSTSVGKFDAVTFSYDYLDANPYAAYLDIYNSAGGPLIRRLGWDPSVIPPNLPAVIGENRRQYFQWNGKDGNGNYVPDGIYVMRPLAVDRTCENRAWLDWYDPNCNRTDAFPTPAFQVKVDNTGANISVVLPQNNIWTNKISYEINGGVAINNSLIAEDKDVSQLFINNTNVPFYLYGQVKNNYKYPVTLAPGLNTYTFKSVDEVGNEIYNYQQVAADGTTVVATLPTLNVNYDTNVPKINSITDVTPAGTIKTVKNLKVTFSDVGGGINKDNIAIDLYSSTKDKVAYKVSNLILGSLNRNSYYLSSFNCTLTECNLNLQNLPDSYYQLFVNVNDIATNSSCTFIQIPYLCNELANFEKIFQVGTPIDGNLLGSDNDTTRSLLSVDLFPTYDGINSSTTLDKLTAGTLDVDHVEKLKVKIKVSQGTEAADLDFTYDTAINAACPYAATNPSCVKRIATLNSSLDTRTQYLGQNANVSKNWGSYLAEKSTITPSKCAQAECVWEYNIVYDSRFLGGFPKITITTYKGLLTDKVDKQWEVNGQLAGTPRVILFDKTDKDPINANVYTSNGVKLFYTNNLKNRILVGADANKAFTLTFRNGTTTFNQSFTNDSFGSTALDLVLPAVDGTWEIVYNGVVIQKFILDRVVPTLVSVQTTNQTNPKAVHPFIRRGDNIKFDYTSSEPVWDSNLVLDATQKVFAEKVTAGCTSIPASTMKYALSTQICNDAWRNSTTNTSTYQINNWQGSAVGVDGIVNPKIELEDYAGNKGSYLSIVQTPVVYTQTPRGVTTGAGIDFRLYAENTSPDKSDFITSNWIDGKDGVNADGINPENDRLPAVGNVKWVIRGNTITFKARGEKNARAVFVNDGIELISSSTSTNCSLGTNNVVNGLVIKFGELCDLSFSYNWTGAGAQDGNGNSLDYKNFQFYTMDLSGNTSLYSSPVTVWNDRTGSAAPIVDIKSVDGNAIVDNVTRSKKLQVTETGERKSDVVTSITSPKSLVTTDVHRHDQFIDFNGAVSNGMGETIQVLSVNFANPTDDTHFAMVGDRRVGTDYDGIYNFSSLDVDTSGNRGAATLKNIERDTVAPVAPTAIVKPDEDNFSVSLQVSGEAGTTAVISGASSSEGPIANPVQGIWKGNYVYSGTYVWNVTLRDKAGNVSASFPISYTTKAAPVYTSYSMSDSSCTADTSGKLLVPYVDEHYITSGWGGRINPLNGAPDDFHYGYDYDLNYNSNVIAAGAGKIIYLNEVTGGTELEIDHGNGLVSLYAHLSQRLVGQGQQVVAGQLIAKSGNSGQVTAAHLHFGVYLNHVARNPADFLYKCDKVPNTQNIEQAHTTKVNYQGTLQSPWSGKTYADVIKDTGQINTIFVDVDEKYNLIGTPKTSDTNSDITFIDNTQDNQIVIYGLSVPINSTWTYFARRKRDSYQCVISGLSCADYGFAQTEQTEVKNSKTVVSVNLINQKDIEKASDTNSTPTNYGDVTDIDSSGRWKIILTKVSDGVYKAANSTNSVTIGQGFTFATGKKVRFNMFEVFASAANVYDAYDYSSNLNVVVPKYKFTGIDQNLFVGGNWPKIEDAYYDPKFLDTRIVKLIPYGNQINPSKINLFIHGWDRDGPSNVNLSTNYRADSVFVDWVYGKYENMGEMAKQSALNDPTTLNLEVVWRDASVDLRFKKSGSRYEQIKNAQPTEASKWIVPVADQIQNHIVQYLNYNHLISELNCVGHSLGSFLCNEIGWDMNHGATTTKINKITALDPATEIPIIKDHEWVFNLNGNSEKRIDRSNYFSQNYPNSVAIYGNTTFCGNSTLAATAQLNIRLNFVDLPNEGYTNQNDCSIHTTVPKTYLNLLRGTSTIYFKNFGFGSDSILTINKVNFNVGGQIWNIGNIDLEGNVIGVDSQTKLDLIKWYGDNSINYYGSNKDDIIKIGTESFHYIDIYGGGGNDTFDVTFTPKNEQLFNMADFDLYDKIIVHSSSNTAVWTLHVFDNGDIGILNNVDNDLLRLNNSPVLDNLKSNLSITNKNYFK